MLHIICVIKKSRDRLKFKKSKRRYDDDDNNDHHKKKHHHHRFQESERKRDRSLEYHPYARNPPRNVPENALNFKIPYFTDAKREQDRLERLKTYYSTQLSLRNRSYSPSKSKSRRRGRSRSR